MEETSVSSKLIKTSDYELEVYFGIIINFVQEHTGISRGFGTVIIGNDPRERLKYNP